MQRQGTMKSDEEQMAEVITLELRRLAPLNASYHAHAAILQPGKVDVRLSHRDAFVTVDAREFVKWLRTPGMTWQKVGKALQAKRNKESKPNTTNENE